MKFGQIFEFSNEPWPPSKVSTGGGNPPPPRRDDVDEGGEGEEHHRTWYSARQNGDRLQIIHKARVHVRDDYTPHPDATHALMSHPEEPGKLSLLDKKAKYLGSVHKSKIDWNGFYWKKV